MVLEIHTVLDKHAEGCPCCSVSIDVDEAAAALNELISTHNTHQHAHSILGEPAHVHSMTHWILYFSLAFPFATLGLTAAIRNINGTMGSRGKLTQLLRDLENNLTTILDTTDHKQQLLAYHTTVAYSLFDATFNMLVPGFINGLAALVVLSCAVWESVLGLPIIASYATLQGCRNIYDLWRTWRARLPVESQATQLYKAGAAKINQISQSKSRFYFLSAVTFMGPFALGGFTAYAGFIFGGSLAPLLPIGLALLIPASLASGIMSNIWVYKFRPRNGSLGFNRLDASNTPEVLVERIGKISQVKKAIKEHKSRYEPASLSYRIQKVALQVITAFPGTLEWGSKQLDKLERQRFDRSRDQLDKNRLALLKEIRDAHNLSSPVDLSSESTEKIWQLVQTLGLDEALTHRFRQASQQDLGKNTSTCCSYDIQAPSHQALDTMDVSNFNETQQQAWNQTLDWLLCHDYLDDLEYQQYGCNDFYWALRDAQERPIQTAASSCWAWFSLIRRPTAAPKNLPESPRLPHRCSELLSRTSVTG